ncbi:MAG: MJ1255/VC2487 family glycosyltransferase [Bacteroidota bacterium]
MNILYGVPGEGMGHATRSKVVIDFLLAEGHNVQVVSSARAYTFLHTHFGNKVHEIKGLHFAYKNAEVSKMGTLMLNLRSAAGNFFHNFSKYLLIEKSFTPDLVISDFESFSFVFAKHHKIPLFSIDNMQVMDRCKLEIPIGSDEKANYTLAKNIVKAKVPGADAYFITSFFEAPVTKKNTVLVPPIIRDAIIKAKTSEGKHVLMYQTSSSLNTVKQLLKAIPEITFYVYGMNKDEQDGNVVFKSFSETGFIKDFASAKAVIANGGFSFISEAVYLRKPVYSFPIRNQFEQYMNAAYIEKMGFGRHFNGLDADNIKAFLYDLEAFKRNLKSYRQEGNEELFAALKKTMKRIKPKQA